MQPDKARLKRLRRLERMRAAAKRRVAGQSAQAEGTLAQLNSLTARTRRMADDYSARGDICDAQALRQTAQFISGLQSIASSADADAAHARGLADRMRAELGIAEQRRAAVQDRLEIEERSLIRTREVTPTSGRKGLFREK